MISVRTKEALAGAKAKGARLAQRAFRALAISRRLRPSALSSSIIGRTWRRSVGCSLHALGAFATHLVETRIAANGTRRQATPLNYDMTQAGITCRASCRSAL